ncbi:hypothetical protein E2562_025889 [Oryza meyeriana var. granulata]|uniref:Uncharacterized protein n=1 Tax=Oryza meyeriana var. granulata TaxID=110450 RepID=A0A6G1D824_9ORYZ|nr:hypothetical protein E2562_025889 [Oryza meyeriana var. granulata]
MEATKAMRPILDEYYKLDPMPIVKATWREAKECMYVEPRNCNGIYWYNKKFYLQTGDERYHLYVIAFE